MNSREMARRLACVRNDLPDGAVLVLTAFSEMQQSRDGAAPFLQEANFLWLTGITEPAWRCIVTRDRFCLVAPAISETQRIFEGGISGEDALRLSVADTCMTQAEAQEFLRDASSDSPVVYSLGADPQASHYSFTLNPAQSQLEEELAEIFSEVKPFRRSLSAARAIKSPDEIAEIRHAIDVTIAAFDAVRDGLQRGDFLHEFEVEAKFTSEIRSRGADGHAYAPIVAGGAHALTLHYAKNSAMLPKSGFLLMDVGASVGGFAADITRTFAVGDVSERGKEVHGAVERAHHEIIELIKPGLSFARYQECSDVIMKRALGDIGLLKDSTDEDTYRRYFPHAVSHGLGLDVHESLGGFNAFKEGMVLTVEPGIYIPEEGIGVRIEDNILVTADGNENMSRHLSTGIGREG